jgi:predicted nucleic acid-binding protein
LLTVLPVDEGVIRAFVQHQQDAPEGASARDLLHLAVATHHGVESILTADRDFDQLTVVTRIDPCSSLA